MKRLVFFSLMCLQGCIGISGLATEKGLHLNSPENTFQSEQKEPPLSYSSNNEYSPGNKVSYEAGETISTSCYRVKPISFMISPVIPLPPIIPIFFLPEEQHKEELIVYVSPPNTAENKMEINIGLDRYLPYKTEGGEYHFNINCASLNGKEATLKLDGVKEIRLQFKSETNIFFGFLGA